MQSEIKNTAYIYFDFNPAIVTNTTSNTNSAVGINENENTLLTVYPNPANKSISFVGANVEKATIFDLSGKKIVTLASVNNNSIPCNELENGVYTIILTTDKGQFTQRLIIQH
jgi:hypothetical protein